MRFFVPFLAILSIISQSKVINGNNGIIMVIMVSDCSIYILLTYRSIGITQKNGVLSLF